MFRTKSKRNWMFFQMIWTSFVDRIQGLLERYYNVHVLSDKTWQKGNEIQLIVLGLEEGSPELYIQCAWCAYHGSFTNWKNSRNYSFIQILQVLSLSALSDKREG
ncbi:hypothetical protein MKX01_032504 [Papaver californicum]|nr:hypothetical protein MKX01_032504 [Papaver californicum]